ncbi:MAG: Fe-S cluster domain-containing protein [Syntrophaceticus sp.]|jgi:Na+-translocating ferredoxin:NAD+ oxidoreductase RNF subunit RnfB|nr:Fe-S cluster domain-containing protein [Syntrophaceticus sp.]HBG22106.1 RnfABCDGE type electron transport complex subunit B [Peptococcaceae bacterium]
METAIAVVVVIGSVGLFFGILLAIANQKLAIEMNPLIHVVEDVLPKGQCGACGFAGCAQYAEAVVLDKDVAPNLCVPGKKEVAQMVAELTGKAAADMESKVAFVRCALPITKAKKKYQYSGIEDCLAASMLLNGPKECKYGCIGLGTCVEQCVFGALKLNDQGLPVVDTKKCTGCGKCADACPLNVIDLIPVDAHVAVFCNSPDKGGLVRKYCEVGCTGCSQCSKLCPHGAITMQDNLPVIDEHVCIEKCQENACLEKCKRTAIQACKTAIEMDKAV